jgi:hypothetical protein
MNTVKVPALVFVSWRNVALQVVLCGMALRHEAKSIFVLWSSGE